LGIFELTEFEFLIHLLKSLNFLLVPIQRKLFISPLFGLNTIVEYPLRHTWDFNKILNFFAFWVIIYEIAEGYCSTCKAAIFLLCTFTFESSTYVLVDSLETCFSANVGRHWVWNFLLHLVLFIIFEHFIVFVDIIFNCTLRSYLLCFTWFIH
jgi:hypothetical protein